MNVDKFIRETLANKIEEAVAEIRKTILHPDNEPNVTLYPKTSIDQVEQLAEQLDYIKTNFVKKFTDTVDYDRVYGVSNLGKEKEFPLYKFATDENTIPLRIRKGSIRIGEPNDIDCAINQRYADKIYEPKRLPVGEVSNQGFLYSTNSDGATFEWKRINQDALYGSIPIRTNNLNFSVGNLTADSPSDLCANKKYVDDAIASISPTTNTKYQHNLVLEGRQFGYTFEAFMSIPCSNNTAITTFDELVSILGDAYIPCTGYIYDGNQKSYNVFAFNTAGPGFHYNDPEIGGQVFMVSNDNVTVSDDPVEF